MKDNEQPSAESAPQPVSRGNFLFRLFAGSTVIAACSLCSLSAQAIPGTRPGAKPQGNGCCKHKHCRYYQG